MNCVMTPSWNGVEYHNGGIAMFCCRILTIYVRKSTYSIQYILRTIFILEWQICWAELCFVFISVPYVCLSDVWNGRRMLCGLNQFYWIANPVKNILFNINIYLGVARLIFNKVLNSQSINKLIVTFASSCNLILLKF